MSLLAHGTRAYGARISHDAALARYMGARVEQRTGVRAGRSGRALDLLLPLRAAEQGGDDEYLSRLNERIMTELQLDGRVYISNAVLGERFVLRACIVNHRTEADDADAVLDVAAELGARIDSRARGAKELYNPSASCRAYRCSASPRQTAAPAGRRRPEM